MLSVDSRLSSLTPLKLLVHDRATIVYSIVPTNSDNEEVTFTGWNPHSGTNLTVPYTLTFPNAVVTAALLQRTNKIVFLSTNCTSAPCYATVYLADISTGANTLWCQANPYVISELSTEVATVDETSRIFYTIVRHQVTGARALWAVDLLTADTSTLTAIPDTLNITMGHWHSSLKGLVAVVNSTLSLVNAQLSVTRVFSTDPSLTEAAAMTLDSVHDIAYLVLSNSSAMMVDLRSRVIPVARVLPSLSQLMAHVTFAVLPYADRKSVV